MSPAAALSRIGASERRFLGIAALAFGASVAVTIAWCASMPALCRVTIDGGWMPSMAWMRMSGQTWTGVAASFVGMWIVMMIAMMLPSLVPALRRYRRAVGAGAGHLDALTTLVATAYFLVWTAVGIAVFPIGVGITAIVVRVPELASAVPVAVAGILAIAGALQFSGWKARQLACCRAGPAHGAAPLPADVRTAWRHGIRHGFHCVACCAGMTATLLAVGVMDLRAMAAVTAAITVERLAPGGERVARVLGVVVIGVGAFVLAR